MKEKQKQYEGLRFFAFLCIFLWHAKAYLSPGFPTGNAAACTVGLFITLSGFLAGWQCFLEGGKTYTKKDIAPYLWRKAKKIYPLYFVTLLVSVAASPLPMALVSHAPEAAGQAKQLMLCLLLLQSWRPEGYFSYNGAAWFLSTIMALYALTVPVKIFLNSRREKSCEMRSVLLFATASLLAEGIYGVVMRCRSGEFYHYIFPAARAGEYAAAMALGYLCARTKSRKPAEKKPAYGLKVSVSVSMLETAAVLVWFYACQSLRNDWMTWSLLWIMPNLFLLYAFSYGNGVWTEMLKGEAVVFLGGISFECFLIHQVFITCFTKNLGAVPESPLARFLCVLFLFGGTAIMAAFCKSRREKGEKTK